MLSHPAHERTGTIQQEVVRFYISWRRFLQRDQLLLLASTVQFALFAPLAYWAHKHPHPPIELGVTHVVQQKHSTFLRATITALSTIAGSAVLMNILVVPAAVILWKRRLRLEAVMTVGISWTSALIRTLIKQVVDRPRPNPLLVHMSDDKKTKSFPSGHVTSSIDFWGWLVALGILRMKGTPSWQKAVLGLPILFVAVTGPSRVYLGDHWATDVLGGYLFGGGWLGLSLHLYLKLREKGILRRE